MSNKLNILMGLAVLSVLIVGVGANPNFSDTVVDIVTTLSENMVMAITIISPTTGTTVGGNNSIGLSEIYGTFSNVTELASVNCTVTNSTGVTKTCDVDMNAQTFWAPYGEAGLQDNGISDGGELHTVNISGYNTTGAYAEDIITLQVDTTAPRNITNITHQEGTNYINWSWDNPTNSDYRATHYNVSENNTGVVVAYGFVNKTDLPSNNSINVTNVTAGTEYKIKLRTFDWTP